MIVIPFKILGIDKSSLPCYLMHINWEDFMKIIGNYDCFIEHTDQENEKIKKLFGKLTVNDLRVYLKKHNLELDRRYMEILDDDLFDGNIPFFVQDKISANVLCSALRDRVYQRDNSLADKELDDELETCYSASKRSIKRLRNCGWAKKYGERELPRLSLIERLIMKRDLKVIDNLTDDIKFHHTYRVAVSADELLIVKMDNRTIVLSDTVEWPRYIQEICQKEQTETISC